MELPQYLKDHIINNAGYLSTHYQRRSEKEYCYLPVYEWAAEYTEEAEKFVKEYWEGHSKEQKLKLLDSIKELIAREINSLNSAGNEIHEFGLNLFTEK